MHHWCIFLLDVKAIRSLSTLGSLTTFLKLKANREAKSVHIRYIRRILHWKSRGASSRRHRHFSVRTCSCKERVDDGVRAHLSITQHPSLTGWSPVNAFPPELGQVKMGTVHLCVSWKYGWITFGLRWLVRPRLKSSYWAANLQLRPLNRTRPCPVLIAELNPQQISNHFRVQVGDKAPQRVQTMKEEEDMELYELFSLNKADMKSLKRIAHPYHQTPSHVFECPFGYRRVAIRRSKGETKIYSVILGKIIHFSLHDHPRFEMCHLPTLWSFPS